MWVYMLRVQDILAKDLPPLPVVTTHPLPVESPADSPGGARADVGTPGSVSSSAGPGDTPSSAYAKTKAVEAGEHAAQKEGEEWMMSGTTAVSNTSPSPSQKRTVTDMFGDEVSLSPQQIEQAEKERAQAEVELGALEGEDSSPLLASTSAAPADAVLSSLEQ